MQHEIDEECTKLEIVFDDFNLGNSGPPSAAEIVLGISGGSYSHIIVGGRRP